MNAGFVVNVHLLPVSRKSSTRYCNVFFAFFYGNISKHHRVAKLIHNNSMASFFWKSPRRGTDRVVKALALPHSSFTISHNTPLSNSGLYYGFYTFSSP